ncbi:MAG TPA: hypothetical protein VFR07_06395 [Mycobacteriales bacterium]|jgi:hypothetical protein|nr:hypothetical protein [Mycobacteriales bacterium]
MKTTSRIAAVGIGVMVLMTPAAAASAATSDDDGPRTKRAGCSGPSTQVLRVAGDDDGRITYTVNTRRAGQVWTFAIREEDDLISQGRRTTNARGDFTVVRRGGDDDRVLATARNVRTGETCRIAIRD